jgi:hypothetical protein
MSDSHLVGLAATRAGLSRFMFLSSVQDFTKDISSPAWSLGLRDGPRGSRSLPTNPREKAHRCHDPRCLPSVDVGAPHLPAEGALLVEQKSRLATNVDPMGFATLVRRDAALRAKKRQFLVLRPRTGFFFALVLARVPSAACLTDDWRKQHFFGLRRSDRILQHD